MNLVARTDALVGGAVEAAVVRRHRRRLARLGWSRALDPPDDGPFPDGDPPPRPGCRMDVLIDGAAALPAIAEAIRSAREQVLITGWHLAPHFELERGEPATPVGALLAEVATRADVRVLVWAGAPVPLFHPTRKEVGATLDGLKRATRIRAEPDPREHPVHCHHEKTVVVDGRVAFVGGIDLTDEAGDRFDSPAHPARRRLGWHDVAARLEGAAVTDVAHHFALRWKELTGDDLPLPDPPAPSELHAGETTVQVVRTVAEDMYDRVPHGDFRILEAYVRALRSARRFVYLENQFLWAPEIVELLAAKLREPPCADFRVVILLPRRANNGQDDTRGQLAVLADADKEGGGDRFLAATIRARSGGRTDPLYVHAKVGIVDDARLIVGSANLNAHSLYNDTEMAVVTDDAELARDARVRLWAEHLELDEATVGAAEPCALVDAHWRPTALEELRRLEAGEPAAHRLLALPGVSRRARRLLGPLEGLVDDG